MITIIIDICIAICGMFFGMALFSIILREKNEVCKNALEKIKERVQSSLNKADSYIILKIINEADAFKHCYFQAELTLFLGKTIAKFIGDRHENKPDNPPQEKEMDLHNNIVGRDIGQKIKQPLWIFTKWQNKIARQIMVAMKEGKLITKVLE